jgi:hypothetical protein
MPQPLYRSGNNPAARPCTHILTSIAPALYHVRACHFYPLHTHVGDTSCCDFFLPFVSNTLPSRLVVVVSPTPCCTSLYSALAAPILDTPCSGTSYKTLRHSPPTICRPSSPIRGHDHRCRQSPAPCPVCGTSVGGRRRLVEDICTHRALDFLSPRRDAQLSRLQAATTICSGKCFTYLLQSWCSAQSRDQALTSFVRRSVFLPDLLPRHAALLRPPLPPPPPCPLPT